MNHSGGIHDTLPLNQAGHVGAAPDTAERPAAITAVAPHHHPDRLVVRKSEAGSAVAVQAMVVRIANAARSRTATLQAPGRAKQPGPATTAMEDASGSPQASQFKDLAGILADCGGRLPPEVRPPIQRLCARLHNQDPALQEVILEDVKLNDAEFAMLLRYLPGHGASHTLNLNGGLLRDARLAALVTALQAKSNLASFSVAHNFLSQQSAAALAAMLDAHPALTQLNLRSNGLRDAGAVLLAGPVQRHPGLRMLDAGYCGIYQTGAAQLRQAVEHKPGFMLKLDDNPVHLSSPG